MRGSVWLGMAVLWAGYGLIFTGYVWLRGYNLTAGEIWGPFNYYKGQWPPSKSIDSGSVFPSASSSSSSAASNG